MTSHGGPDLGVLQVGFGGFGPTHLEAWRRLGFDRSRLVADADAAARAHGLPSAPRSDLARFLFRPLFEEAPIPHHIPTSLVEIVASRLETFLGHVAARVSPEADVRRYGVARAELYEVIGRPAAAAQPVALAGQASR